MKRRVVLLLLSLLLLPLAVRANEAIKVGDETIAIPLPTGFVRFDGLNPQVDQLMQSMIPPTNRSLLVGATAQDAALAKAKTPGNLSRFMNIQTMVKVEGEKISLSEFETVRGELEKQFAASGTGPEGFQSEVNKRIADAKLPIALKLGETRMLGVYEKSDRSIDMGMMMNTQVGTQAPETMVAAASCVDVRGKVLFLYVYADYHNQADVDWTRTTVKSWRESILATNPGGTPAGGFDWNSIMGKAVIGACIGGGIGLLSMLFKKKA